MFLSCTAVQMLNTDVQFTEAKEVQLQEAAQSNSVFWKKNDKSEKERERERGLFVLTAFCQQWPCYYLC